MLKNNLKTRNGPAKVITSFHMTLIRRTGFPRVKGGAGALEPVTEDVASCVTKWVKLGKQVAQPVVAVSYAAHRVFAQN